MRKAFRRKPDNTDYGLPPFRARHIIINVMDSIRGGFRYFFTHSRETYRLRRRIAASTTPLNVSIGCGYTVPSGWIGIDFKRGRDVFRCDLRRTLPFPDQSVDAILAEHILEHFPLDDLQLLIREIHRVLKPNAPFRIACPDALIIADLLKGHHSERVALQIKLERRVHGWEKDDLLKAKIVNRISHQFGEHHSLLTAETMTVLLENAGFSEVNECGPLDSHYFEEVPSTHFEEFPDSIHEVFVLEAVKERSRSEL